jgi:hypothetical protein
VRPSVSQALWEGGTSLDDLRRIARARAATGDHRARANLTAQLSKLKRKVLAAWERIVQTAGCLADASQAHTRANAPESHLVRNPHLN